MAHKTTDLFALGPIPPKPAHPCTERLTDGTVCGSTRFWLKRPHLGRAQWVCWTGELPPLVMVCETTEEAEPLRKVLQLVRKEAAARQLEFDGMDV